jgi:hypothetical protein
METIGATYRTTATVLRMPHYLALLARACEIAGQIDEALTLLDEALQIVERTGERWFFPPSCRRRPMSEMGHEERFPPRVPSLVSSFDGNAVVRIERQEKEITLR